MRHAPSHGSGVQPPGGYGALQISKLSSVSDIQEKPHGDDSSIKVSFLMLEPKVIDYIEGDATN